jgi:hypothetical protein
MPPRASKGRRRKPGEPDENETTHRLLSEAVERLNAGDDPLAAQRQLAAAILSKLGASKGGRARAAKLSPEERRAIARRAAKRRWSG